MTGNTLEELIQASLEMSTMPVNVINCVRKLVLVEELVISFHVATNNEFKEWIDYWFKEVSEFVMSKVGTGNVEYITEEDDDFDSFIESVRCKCNEFSIFSEPMIHVSLFRKRNINMYIFLSAGEGILVKIPV